MPFFLRRGAAVLTELVGLVDTGDLKVEIAQRVSLPELIKVHEEAEAGRLRGKVVVVPFGAVSYTHLTLPTIYSV